MKIKPSIKKICAHCKIVRRQRRVYIQPLGGLPRGARSIGVSE